MDKNYIFLQQICMPIVATSLSSNKNWSDYSPEQQQLIRKCIHEIGYMIDNPPSNIHTIPKQPCNGCV